MNMMRYVDWIGEKTHDAKELQKFQFRQTEFYEKTKHTLTTVFALAY